MSHTFAVASHAPETKICLSAATERLREEEKKSYIEKEKKIKIQIK